ncbi:malto-oligosyltrehalose synthase [Adhaeribacter sp. BT258]|uniref:Malto-oligosyltrehalose synthase n=1 Tax=Adhaeribacter terrigena TaxID=2793070 RepID=A0ABS1C0X7_9BACT|nr:malto-oligosyltrehalose synthase [Adhaeribacter terrigena]MBK0402989.1 malto-oligosyltrehalose synthase [Adhaeribacter terrigena]
MFVPAATYRIQFHKDFTFRDLMPQIPYLKALGIGTIYASPIFKARPGSTHGYDVTNAQELNPEIGSRQDFEALQQLLKENQMFWLQDIVPNHMAFHQDNGWLMDIFEHGPASEFYNFFDVNWEHENPELTGKLMAPFLGSTLEEALEKGDVKLVFGEGGFKIQFYENQFPASFTSWPLILEKLTENGRENAPKTLQEPEISSLLQAVESEDNKDELAAIKTQLLTHFQNAETLNWLQNGIEIVNKSPEQLQQILDKQFFRLTLWSDSDQQINYRRFFTINELICLRMEDETVFKKYHQFIFSQYQQGYFQGLRIDHIDGLADPVTYLHRLRELVGNDCYITVEKILDLGEELPVNWPVQGTTGYFFLAVINQLATSVQAEKAFDEIYWKHVPEARESDYEQLVFEKKMYMLENHMRGETDNLFNLFKNLELLPDTPGFTEKSLKDALQILLAAFPVYRLYTNQLPVEGQDAAILEKAFARARKFALHLKKELTYFHQLFVQTDLAQPDAAVNRLHFLMRCQQFTGPLAAKGVEDTTFYNYNRLISHNEVGDDPEVFGITVSRFHQEMLERQRHWPLAQNATATHDTKRGEDARMRLNVLTEMPEKWARILEQWETENEPFVQTIDGHQVPSRNRIFYLYQALLAAFPMDGQPEADFQERVKEALTKAMREAKMYSNWSEPNEKYEQEALDFLGSILTDGTAFKSSFQAFARLVSFYGMLYSLGQTLLKITSPGIPDIYQGCELWDLSMVDPDNRRPVNFESRKNYLQELQETTGNGRENALKSMMQNWTDGKIKMYVTWCALQFRKARKELFTQGEYLPLKLADNPNVLAFGWKLETQWCLVIIPLELGKLTEPETFPLGEQIWKDEMLVLPANAPKKWKNIFTDQTLSGENKLALAEIFKLFPVACLTSETV